MAARRLKIVFGQHGAGNMAAARGWLHGGLPGSVSIALNVGGGEEVNECNE